jgi:hypothetical protein
MARTYSKCPGDNPLVSLSKTLQLINACPTPLGWNYDPIALVRAANHLRALGKDKAIASLREFLDVAHDTGYDRDRIDPASFSKALPSTSRSRWSASATS